MNVTKKISDAIILSMNGPVKSCILNSGASFHSCPSREIMENYVSDDFGKAYLANNEPLKIVAKGDVRIKTPNEHVWLLQNMYILDWTGI